MELPGLRRPIRALLLAMNIVLWLVFATRIALHWGKLSARVHFIEVFLLILYPLLWRSLVFDEDRTSHLFYATGVFFGTLLAVVLIK